MVEAYTSSYLLLTYRSMRESRCFYGDDPHVTTIKCDDEQTNIQRRGDNQRGCRGESVVILSTEMNGMFVDKIHAIVCRRLVPVTDRTFRIEK